MLRLITGVRTIISSICCREVGEKDPQDLAIDSSGTKSYAAFISELASVLPSQSRAGVTYLIPHLNGEVNKLFCFFFLLFW